MADCVEISKYAFPKCDDPTNTLRGNIITNDEEQSVIEVDYCNMTAQNTTTFIEKPCSGLKPWTECNIDGSSCYTSYIGCVDFYTKYADY